MYRYFVAYSYKGKNGNICIGNTESRINKQIDGIDDINAIARSLERDFGLPQGAVVVTNWKRF